MLERSEAYKAAITDTRRMTLLKAIIEIIDPDIVLGTGTTSGAEDFANLEQLVDKDRTGDKLATLEGNRWALDGTFPLLPDSGGTGGQVGAVGTLLSGADGTFSTPQWVEQPFSGVEILQACSIYFPTDPEDGVAEDFTVSIIQNGTVYHEQSFVGNTASAVDVKEFTVYGPEAIRVTVSKWSLPSRRMRVLEILPGIYEEWDSAMISGCSITQSGDVSCLSLPYGTCTLSIDNQDRRFEPRNKTGIFLSIQERQGIPISIGVALPEGGAEFKPLGVYYQHSGGWRTGDNGLTMTWDLVDIIGLLARRTFLPPDSLPDTLGGWIAALAAQLGDSFADRWHVDPEYADIELICGHDDIEGRTCGDILRWVCMASGTWPRADALTGDLVAEPLWSEGGELTLDNLESYPVIRANTDLAAIIFTLNDSDRTKFVVSGNSTSSNETVSVSNPFIRSEAAALAAAKHILVAYGGNRLETLGRGDPAEEIGDVDTVWLDDEMAATGRRIQQTFAYRKGQLRGCKSVLLQADGSYLFAERAVLTESGTWTAPAGVTALRVILVGKGEDGGDGTDGTWTRSGTDGEDGRGGLIWAGTISINEGQTLDISITDEATTLGTYSSADGKRYPTGYTDVTSGSSYGRSGVSSPVPGSGDGGKGGKGGVKGNRHEEVIYEDTWLGQLPTTIVVVDNKPGSGKAGAKGASGCAVIYWEKPE